MAADSVKKEEEKEEAKGGDDKMAPPPAAGAAAAGGAKNTSGSDAIKAAVKAGNINIHQEERKLPILLNLSTARPAVPPSMIARCSCSSSFSRSLVPFTCGAPVSAQDLHLVLG